MLKGNSAFSLHDHCPIQWLNYWLELLSFRQLFINYWLIIQLLPFQRFTEPQLIDQSVYILIAIGGLMFFLGFLGYCGAIRESQCMLSLVRLFLSVIGWMLTFVCQCHQMLFRHGLPLSTDRDILAELCYANSRFIRLFCCGLRGKSNFSVQKLLLFQPLWPKFEADESCAVVNWRPWNSWRAATSSSNA